MIPLSAYTAVSAVLFMTGLLGVLVRRNFIIVLMSVEIMMNAANINLVAFSHYLESMAGQLVALFIIAIAAGEAAVGLAIIIVVFRGKISTNVGRNELVKVVAGCEITSNSAVGGSYPSTYTPKSTL